MGKIDDAVRYMKRAIEADLGNSIRVVLSPHSTGLDDDIFSELPTLVLQGPEIVKNKRDYSTRSVKTGEEAGVNINTLTRARTILNLVFRVRLFTDSLIGALPWIEKLIELANSLYDINVPRDETGIVFSGDDPVNIALNVHEMSDGDTITITVSSDAGSLPNGEYVVTVVDRDNISVDYDGDGNGGTCTISYTQYNYNVNMSDEFSPDTVPNFSDVKHYESALVIEDIEIETNISEEAYESSGGVSVEQEVI